tara:strand:- start:418 stop:831 length:414 start_codon:yes stop_codon:yes gene_type:complete
MTTKNTRKSRPEAPSAEELISEVIVPQELAHLPCFQETWAEWCDYKQNESIDDRSGVQKPWRTLQAAQREMTHIKNQLSLGRDVVHVIAESMRNQWIGIRFDLISDRTGSAAMPKTRDQVSALDLEWSKLNQTNQLN